MPDHYWKQQHDEQKGVEHASGMAMSMADAPSRGDLERQRFLKLCNFHPAETGTCRELFDLLPKAIESRYALEHLYRTLAEQYVRLIDEAEIRRRHRDTVAAQAEATVERFKGNEQ